MSKANYLLRCTLCGATYLPDPFRLQCDAGRTADHAPSLLRTVYAGQQLNIKPYLPGIFRFIDWLPADQSLEAVGKPITYESQHLARYLGLEHLLISFSGYWPERNAHLLTCSFKELEAASVVASIPTYHPETLVISSAGNSGRAFANICSRHGIPLCLVVPETCISAIWSMEPFHDCITLIVVNDGGDYTDAIALGGLISKIDGFFLEGGAANVARRDGMGLTVIDAAVTLGRIPDHYFQAVGSGTGGIAAWEAMLRLQNDGRFGGHSMKLHLSQNAPFTPMVDAWNARSPMQPSIHEQQAKEQIGQVSAQVLTNRQPAYAITGGVYDALTETHGEMYAVSNDASEQARDLFRALEGIDISPAAGVATASLIQAIEAQTIGRKDYVLLNVTSGGIQRMQQSQTLHYLTPDLVFSPREINFKCVTERLNSLSKPSKRRVLI